MKPDLVILYSMVNSTFSETLRLKHTLTEDEYNNIKNTSKILQQKPIRLLLGMSYWLKSKVFFYYGMSRLAFWLQHNRYLRPPKDVPAHLGRIDYAVQSIQKELSKLQREIKTSNFQESLNMAIFSARQNGVPIILGVEPIAPMHHFYYDTNAPENKCLNDRTFEMVHHTYADVVRKTAKDNNLIVADIDRVFKEDPETNNYFADRVHMDDRGNRLIARRIGDLIMKNNLIK